MKLDLPLGGIVLFAGYPVYHLRELININLSEQEAKKRCKCLD